MFTINQIDQLQTLGFGMPGIPEMLIIGGVFLLVFGGAKLPGLMRNLGRSVNEFKAGIKEPVHTSHLSDEAEGKVADQPEEVSS